VRKDSVPNRILRDGILRSEKVAKLTPTAELFYRRLMSVADDYGRYYANEALLLSDCYPIRPAWADAEMIALSLAECVQIGLILTYEVSGTKFLEIANFEQRIRPNQKSKFPPPAEIRRDSREISAKAESESESEAYAEAEAKPARSARAGTAKPQMPPPTLRTEAGREYPNPAWVKAQEALRESRESIARARDPVAYETAILQRVVGA
jgi:hypothetical protein